MNERMTLASFAGKLSLVIPKRVMPLAGRVYLDAVTQLFNAIVIDTPVDTGFLRAGLSASAAGVEPEVIEQSKGRTLKNGDTSFRGLQPPSPASAIFASFAKKSELTIGFQAVYAPYVEDTRHMVALARVQWPSFVQSAVLNASTGGDA